MSSDLSLLSGLRGIISYAIDRLEEELKSLKRQDVLERLGTARLLAGLRRRNQFLGDLFEAVRNEIDGVVMILNTYVEESLDKLNDIMYILSIVFGVVGAGEYVLEALSALGFSAAYSLRISMLIMAIIGGIGVLAWFVAWRRR